MPDSKLSALTSGTTPNFLYGIEGGVPKKYAGDGMFNVKDFGAVGDGVNNDGPAIQAAINMAAAVSISGGQAQGATIYLPTGVYKTLSTIKDPASGSGIVRLVGGGAGNGSSSTQIRGALSGYILDVPDLWPNFTRTNSTSYLGGCGVIWTTGTTVWSCLRPGTSAASPPSITGKIVGDTVVDGTVTWLMLSATLNAASNINCLENLEIVNTDLTLGNGAFRIDRLASGYIKQCRFQGMNAFHASGNMFGATFIGVCCGTPHPTIGTPGTYGAIVGQSTWIGCVISGFDVGLAHYGADIHVSDGHIENNNTAIVLGMDPTGNANLSHGCVIMGNSFENNNTCMNIQGASALSVMSNNFTGVVAVNHFNVTLTGTTTNASTTISGLSSTAQLTPGMAISSVSGGFTANSNVATIVDGTTITINKPAIASGARSILFQNTVTAGIVVGMISGGMIANNTIGMACTNAGMDLSNSNCDTLTIANNYVQVKESLGAGVEFKLPPAQHRADITWGYNYNCPSTAFPFSDLPGQPGVHLSTPIEGMTYDITDCSTSTFLATAAAGGTGATAHRRVRYNGSSAVWQVIG